MFLGLSLEEWLGILLIVCVISLLFYFLISPSLLSFFQRDGPEPEVSILTENAKTAAAVLIRNEVFAVFHDPNGWILYKVVTVVKGVEVEFQPLSDVLKTKVQLKNALETNQILKGNWLPEMYVELNDR